MACRCGECFQRAGAGTDLHSYAARTSNRFMRRRWARRGMHNILYNLSCRLQVLQIELYSAETRDSTG